MNSGSSLLITRTIFVDILQIPSAYKYLAAYIDKEAKKHPGKPTLTAQSMKLTDFFKILDSSEFKSCMPPYCSGRMYTESLRLAAEIANIYCQKYLPLQVMHDGLVIFSTKQRQLMLDGLPLNTKLLMETFWCIDRTMSERVLVYWIKKFKDRLEITPDPQQKGVEGKDNLYLLRSYEYMYLLINTKSKSQLVLCH